MKKNINIIIVSIIILIVFILYLNIHIDVIDNNNIIKVNDNYIEEGANVYFNKYKLDTKINIKGKVNTKKIGNYKIIYSKYLKIVKKNIKVIDDEKPIIKLIGNDVTIYTNTEYYEYGYSAYDNYDKDITDKVEISNNIDNSKEGIYQVTYKVKDSSNNETIVTRNIIVKDKLSNFDNYQSIDNTNIGWGITQYTNGIRPEYKDIDYYKEYNTYFLGKDEKILYLTFDEGGNLITYVDQIVDILNKYNIKATFFMCKDYMLENPELINKIVDSGHIIGNHTVHHYSMNELSNNYDSFMSEIIGVEDAYYQVTGKHMQKIFRYPQGDNSKKTLAIMHDLGYRTIFWSVFYEDWNNDVSKEYAYNVLTSHRHNGAIYLIHPKNKGNYEALEDFIIDSMEKGYTFDLVSNI